MHHISILVFGLYDHGSWPSTAYVIFVQDQRCLLGVCVRVWLQPPGWKERTNGGRQGSKLLREGITNRNLNCKDKAKIKFTTNTYFKMENAKYMFCSCQVTRIDKRQTKLGRLAASTNIYLARRPPLEFCTQVMKSSRKECSLVWRCKGRFPSRASRMVGEWDKARPFPRIPEWDLHTWVMSKEIRIKEGRGLKRFHKTTVSRKEYLWI